MRIRTLTSAATLLVTLLICPAGAAGQYFGTQVLEKSFDKTDFFFKPNYVNPYGFDGFGAVAPGLIRNPMLDLQVNPASQALDSIGSSTAYIDFRQSRKPTQNYYYCCDYLYERATTDELYTTLPYPYYPNQQPPTPEPLFVAAYHAKPSNRVAFGVSYQLLFNDSDYFSVPADIYRASATEDFTSTPVTDAYAAPIIDVAGGSNNMRTSGHMASANAASQFGRLAVGGRIAATFFARDGLVADQNRWTNQQQQFTTSLWSTEESRNVDYKHVDGSLGLMYAVGPASYVGISGGFLSGSADQSLARTDTSYYQTGSLVPNEHYSNYVRGGATDQMWNHDGETAWISANAMLPVSGNASISLLYRLEDQNTDILLASTVRDTSNSRYRYFYNNGQYASRYESALSDVRTGFGKTTGTSHRGAIVANWQIDRKTQLSLGGDVNSRLTTTRTTEDVLARQYSNSDDSFDITPPTDEFQSTEAKELHWYFRSRTTTVAFPIHLTTRLSSRAKLEFGINRRLVIWNIEDVTTAAIDYRIVNNNGTITRVDDIVERYTEPASRQSEVRTTLLAGLTLSPTDKLDIRMLVAPEYQNRYGTSNFDFRWWIGLGIHP